MNTMMETVFGLAGGLAMFLFGMNMMSEGLQKAAGEKMKNILALLTRNPVLGVLAGALVTAVLQSSSATTVMVIGFVSAGLMTLPQAISVILGANIGTTMTAQLMAFKISDYIWLIVFVGFMISFISKNERVKNIGQTIFAFGALFVGIETMGSVMKPLASSPVFTSMIAKVAHVPILGVGVGALMTLVVQSSSATIAVLQNFASQAGPGGTASIIGLTGAIPILLGDNIGTTITALLASVGQNKNARRTAVAHSVFNITGSLVFIWIIPWFAKFVEMVSPKGPELEIISRQIANAHTTFNIVCTIAWLPFIWVLVKIVTAIVPGEDVVKTEDRASRYLDYKVIGQPIAALKLVTREVDDLTDEVKNLLVGIQGELKQSTVAELGNLREKSRLVSSRAEETLHYTAALFASGGMTEFQAAYTSDMVVVIENIENINMRCREVCGYGAEKMENNYDFSQDAEEEIENNMTTVISMYDKTMQYLKGQIENPSKDFENEKEKMIKQRNKARKNNAKRMQQKECQRASGTMFNNTLFCLERISHCCFNMMENDVSSFNTDLTAGSN